MLGPVWVWMHMYLLSPLARDPRRARQPRLTRAVRVGAVTLRGAGMRQEPEPGPASPHG